MKTLMITFFLLFSLAIGANTSANDPLNSLQDLMQAQAEGDSARMMDLLALDQISDQDLLTLQELNSKITSFMTLENLEIKPLALGISKQGNFALVRFISSFDIMLKGSTSSIHQTTGNLALLKRINGIWKVYSIVADDLLTLEVFEQPSLSAAPSRLVKPLSVNYASSFVAPTRGLIELNELNETINRSVNDWHVDESKMSKDIVFSAFGHIPIMGDAVSNSYTVYERLKTVFVEIPEDYNNGNLEATLLDIGLVAWAPVQFVAEYIPGVDTYSDVFEASLEAYRYNAIQRFNYLVIKRALLAQNFRDLKKYLLLRFTPKNVIAKNPKHLDGETYPAWHNKSLALKKLIFLSDLFLRSDPRIYFDIAAEFAIFKKDNETLFDMASKLGAVVDRGSYSTEDDDVAYLPLKLTTDAASIITKGDPILKDGTLDVVNKMPKFNLTATRGQQSIAVKMKDGSETEAVLINNLVFNAIVDIQVNSNNELNLNSIQTRIDNGHLPLHVSPVMASHLMDRVIAPEINGLAELSISIFHPNLFSLGQDNFWPHAGYQIIPLTAGSTRLDFSLNSGEGVPAVTKSIDVQVISASNQKFVWVLKEVNRKGMYAETLPDSSGEQLDLISSDLSVHTTRTRKYFVYQDGKNVEISYTTQTFGSWGIPNVIVPGTAFSVNLKAGHIAEKFEYLTTLVASLPAWDKASSVNVFPVSPLAKVLRAKSGENISETVKLYAPSIEAGAFEGQRAKFSFALYETNPDPSTIIPKNDLRASRTFTYVLVKLPQ